jgi:hypothetical protein
MSELIKIIEKYHKFEIDSQEAFEQLLVLFNNGRSFIFELIKKETEYNKQLSKNLDLYKSKNSTIEYDKTFSQWNKSNLVLWDLKDILCRMGEDID